MKIFKRTKEKKDAKIAAGIKSLTDKLKIKDKIAKANQWADKHKKKVSLITIGTLMLSLLIGSWLTLTSTYNEAAISSLACTEWLASFCLHEGYFRCDI